MTAPALTFHRWCTPRLLHRCLCPSCGRQSSCSLFPPATAHTRGRETPPCVRHLSSGEVPPCKNCSRRSHFQSFSCAHITGGCGVYRGQNCDPAVAFFSATPALTDEQTRGRSSPQLWSRCGSVLRLPISFGETCFLSPPAGLLSRLNKSYYIIIVSQEFHNIHTAVRPDSSPAAESAAGDTARGL